MLVLGQRECGEDDGGVRAAFAAEDAVGAEGDVRRDTPGRVAVTGAAGADDAGDVRAVALAVVRVRVGNRVCVVVRVVSVAHEVPTRGDTSRRERCGAIGPTATEISVVVVDAGVDDADLDAGTVLAGQEVLCGDLVERARDLDRALGGLGQSHPEHRVDRLDAGGLCEHLDLGVRCGDAHAAPELGVAVADLCAGCLCCSRRRPGRAVAGELAATAGQRRRHGLDEVAARDHPGGRGAVGKLELGNRRGLDRARLYRCCRCGNDGCTKKGNDGEACGRN